MKPTRTSTGRLDFGAVCFRIAIVAVTAWLTMTIVGVLAAGAAGAIA